MSQLSCDSLRKDITAIHMFLTAQSRIADTGDAMQGHCNNLVGRIHMTVMDFESATALITTIDAGPWTQEQKTYMSQAIHDRLQDVVIGKVAKVRRKNQTCSSFERYLSESDVLCLASSDFSRSLGKFRNTSLFD